MVHRLVVCLLLAFITANAIVRSYGNPEHQAPKLLPNSARKTMLQIVGVPAYTGTSNTGTTDVLMPEVVDSPSINSIHNTDFKLEEV